MAIEAGTRVRMNESAYFRVGETGVVVRRVAPSSGVLIVRFDKDAREAPVFEIELEAINE